MHGETLKFDVLHVMKEERNILRTMKKKEGQLGWSHCIGTVF